MLMKEINGKKHGWPRTKKNKNIFEKSDSFLIEYRWRSSCLQLYIYTLRKIDPLFWGKN